MKKCCICQNQKSQGKLFVLKEEEKISNDAPEELFYCNACLKIVEDPEAGAQLFKGLLEMKMRELGAPDTASRKMGEHLYNTLKKRKLH